MLEINKRYVRFAPKDDQTVITIKSEQELKYHQELQKNGYRYEEVIENTGPKNVCISCEG